MGRLCKIWKVKKISVFLYGAECWSLNKNDEHKILSAEMNWLQRIAEITTTTATPM